MGPAPLGGSCEREKVPSPWEPHSPAGRSEGTDRELQRLRRECSSRFAAGRRERDQDRQSLPPHCTSQPKTCTPLKSEITATPTTGRVRGFSGFIPVALWVQCLRDIQADYQHSPAEAGLVPGAAGFVGAHKQKQGWNLSWLPAFPQRRQGRGQCQQQCILWAHALGNRWWHRVPVPVDSPWRGIWSSSFPRGSAPVPPTSQCSLELDLGASTPTTGKQTLLSIGLWQPQSKEEALPNIQCKLWSSQHQSYPISRGWWPAKSEERHGRHPYQKTAVTPKIMDSWRLHRDAPT